MQKKRQRMDIQLRSRIKKITTLIFDVDGVFTDATLIVGESDVQRVFNVRDGYAVQIAARMGYRLAVITGGKQESIKKRLTGLGVKDVFYGVGTDKKLEVFDKYLADNNLTEDEILYMGDDLPDYEIFTQRNVLSTCPADAVNEIKQVSKYISPINGGRGAVRDVIEMIMKAQKKWMVVF